LKKLLYKILLGANIFFALTLLLSYLAVHISPGDFFLPAFFGLGYPYLLLINIVFIIIWAMLLKFEALISTAVIILGLTHFSNYLKLFRHSADKTNTFKVISYNVHLFNYLENKKDGGSEKKIISFLRSQKAEVICLQEFFGIGKSELKETEFSNSLGEKYYSHIKVLGNGKNRFYGIATFSRFPIIRKGEIIHPSSSSLSIYTDILVGNDTIRIYNNHLQSFHLMKLESSFVEELSSSDDNETLQDVKKISLSLKKGFIRRALQSQVVKDNIDRSAYPVIVAGDFNDTPVSYSYRKIRKGLGDSFVNSGYGAGFTYRGNYPPNRIDYVLYNKVLVNSFFETIRIKYSDHYPIVAYFKKKS
jgi:endonuclease/exonuclease/phosphatase family metal-dependent hydrolase